MATPAPRLQAFRGGILHFVDDPAQAGEAAVVVHEDGLLVLADGHVSALGEAAALLPGLPPHAELTAFHDRLLMPGFIDCHVHYPQTDVIASHGEQLLSWLERYVFPCEARFADATVARAAAGFFCDELLRNGTTSAMCFATVHPQAVDALFAAAEARAMRIITGLVLMDRNAPPALCVDAELAHEQGEALIARWHGRGRARYAVTPRFAASSSPRQLELAARQFAAHPGVHLQSHLAENRDELAWVAALFPGARSYLDVFDRFGLLGERAIYAHCIHIDDADRQRLADSGSAIAFCPSSNLFLGSGLFDLAAARAQGVRVGLATDVGAGTSFSMLRTMAEAYKVGQLRGQASSPLCGFYQATLGAARALRLEDRIGSFAPGCEGDFVVLDLAATPLLARRTACARGLEERLFALMMLGDEHAVAETWVMGERRHRRAAA